ncbi:hypothetical protein GMRT_25091 [Giardia muris]|uniref:Uncharacterized protein n=1 Tax=Giardia muris TaxID=5742 RepID=A0A4Z1SKM8_GIAMU|nr:hypothetical protein GMRT_25091 [Giardia muris]|eukprot:TNJ26152.1 hypothetical protein GMRT_25091 [Giardia muris]
MRRQSPYAVKLVASIGFITVLTTFHLTGEGLFETLLVLAVALDSANVYKDAEAEIKKEAADAYFTCNLAPKSCTLKHSILVHLAEGAVSVTLCKILAKEADHIAASAYIAAGLALDNYSSGIDLRLTMLSYGIPVLSLHPPYAVWICLLVLFIGMRRRVLEYSGSVLFDDAVAQLPALCANMRGAMKAEERASLTERLLTINSLIITAGNLEDLHSWCVHVLASELECPVFLLTKDRSFFSVGCDATRVRHALHNQSIEELRRSVSSHEVPLLYIPAANPAEVPVQVHVGTYYLLGIFLSHYNARFFMGMAQRVDACMTRRRRFFLDSGRLSRTILMHSKILLEERRASSELLRTFRGPPFALWQRLREPLLTAKKAYSTDAVQHVFQWMGYMAMVYGSFRFDLYYSNYLEIATHQRSPLTLNLLKLYVTGLHGVRCELVCGAQTFRRFGILQALIDARVGDDLLREMTYVEHTIYYLIMSYLSSRLLVQPIQKPIIITITRGALKCRGTAEKLVHSGVDGSFFGGKTRRARISSPLLAHLDETTGDVLILSTHCDLSFRTWYCIDIGAMVDRAYALDATNDFTIPAEETCISPIRRRSLAGIISAGALLHESTILLNSEEVTVKSFFSTVHSLNAIVRFATTSCTIHLPEYLDVRKA